MKHQNVNVHIKWNCFITIRDDIIVSQRLPWKRGGANKSGAWLTANVHVRRAGRAHCARYIKFSHVRKSKFLSDSDSEPVFFLLRFLRKNGVRKEEVLGIVEKTNSVFNTTWSEYPSAQRVPSGYIAETSHH